MTRALTQASVGEYLQADRVNQMIDDPNTVFVDMRNHYEYEVGHFENAIEVPSDTFRDQLPMAVEMLQDSKDKTSSCTAPAAFAVKSQRLYAAQRL